MKNGLSFLGAGVLSLALFAASASAQGLSGPSSSAADLQPGDGLTDPQFRSDFPRSVLPGWYAWKDRLAENGLSFNLDYLTLSQTSNSEVGAGEASSGIARLYGTWKATETGSLTFKIEDRHAFTDVARSTVSATGHFTRRSL